MPPEGVRFTDPLWGTLNPHSPDDEGFGESLHPDRSPFGGSRMISCVGHATKGRAVRAAALLCGPRKQRFVVLKILVMGLPGAGKTSLARTLAPSLGAVLFNADEVRANINKDLGFSLEDRIEHARRMGWLCDRVVEASGIAIADFVCPTEETRAAFGAAFVVWMDRISQGRFLDTNRLFAPPRSYDIRVSPQGSPEEWASSICAQVTRERKQGRFSNSLA